MGEEPNELPPSSGWPYLVENIKLFSKPSEAQTLKISLELIVTTN